MPTWAEQLTAIATAVSALGLLSAIGAVVFAARQAREARVGRQAAIDRWELWQPTIDAIGGEQAYPMFARLVTKMRAAVSPGLS
jgi:hypothetical protein